MENTKSNDIDVINHLLQVEKESARLIDDALKTAEQKLSEAHAKYNSEFKAKYDKGIEILEKQFQSDCEKEKIKSEKSFEEYKMILENQKQDVKAFNNLLESVLLQNQ